MELYSWICQRLSILLLLLSILLLLYLLFLVNINDLPTAVHHCSVSLYADNAVLYCYSFHINDLENVVNEDLSRKAL